MIEVIEVLNDPDLCSSWTVQRNYGQYAAGGWQTTKVTTIQAYGAVRNLQGRQIEMVPEADRVHELMTFRSTTPMYVTDAAQGITSDIITWQGSQYRVSAVKQYQEQGYVLAIGARLAGA